MNGYFFEAREDGFTCVVVAATLEEATAMASEAWQEYHNTDREPPLDLVASIKPGEVFAWDEFADLPAEEIDNAG
jgi:predicted RNase H-like HicB family nuclease